RKTTRCATWTRWRTGSRASSKICITRTLTCPIRAKHAAHNAGLLGGDPGDREFRDLHIPICAHVLEGQAEILGFTRFQWSAAQWSRIDIWLARSDHHQSLTLFLRDLAQTVVEEDLHGRATHSLAAVVGDLAFDVGDLLAGKVVCRAHGDIRNRQTRSVRIDGCGCRIGLSSAGEDDDDDNRDHYRSGADDDGAQWRTRLIALAANAFQRRKWRGRLTHAQDFTPCYWRKTSRHRLSSAPAGRVEGSLKTLVHTSAAKYGYPAAPGPRDH